MTKNYFIFLLLFCVSSSLFAQETLTFAPYMGSGDAITATTATINDEITVVFEDVDIINDFYSENQNTIYMYLGLETSAGAFQAVPGSFSDLSWQPQLMLTDGDASAPTNTYSITFTPGLLFPSLDGETILGINLLFQNQFGGGGNNQTGDLFIDLVDAALDFSTLSVEKDSITNVKAFYTNETLVISGLNEMVDITIHNLLGKRVANYRNVAISGNYRERIQLNKNNIYIVTINSTTFNKTFKIVAR